MADTLKVLGQVISVPNSLIDLYTVPSSSQATVSSIMICNQNLVQVTFRISVAIGGAVDSRKQYLYYDLPLLNNDTFVATIGLSLGAGDKIRVQSDTDDVSFNLFGVEVT